jgi:hypothetical protein
MKGGGEAAKEIQRGALEGQMVIENAYEKKYQ